MGDDSTTHLRSSSEMRRKSPYLPDTARFARMFVELRASASPQKVSRAALLNDAGADMFRVVSERKETREQLQAMENRIKALQLAEAKAKKRLEEAKKIADEKQTLQLLKQRESEEKQHWRETVEQQRLAERERIEKERQERKQKLQTVRELTLTSKRGKAQALKIDSHAKIEGMKMSLDRERERKERKRLDLSFDYRRMHMNFEAEERDQKVRVSSMFQNKKDTQVRMKQDMENRIRELEVLEQRIIENLKKTYSYHQDEVQRLEKIVTKSRDMTQSPTSALGAL